MHLLRLLDEVEVAIGGSSAGSGRGLLHGPPLDRDAERKEAYLAFGLTFAQAGNRYMYEPQA